jgi:hypothetical protein
MGILARRCRPNFLAAKHLSPAAGLASVVVGEPGSHADGGCVYHSSRRFLAKRPVPLQHFGETDHARRNILAKWTMPAAIFGKIRLL